MGYENSMTKEQAKIQFDEREVPINQNFDDPYYSFLNGEEESEYVFLQGNQLSERLKSQFHIAELGFGTGLNFFLLWELWQNLGIEGQIQFTSFELYPMAQSDRRRALLQFPKILQKLELFEAQFCGQVFENSLIKLNIIEGDARKTLPCWNGQADAWFLDGFSPLKNPELWEENLLKSVFEHSRQGATASTYSAAGHIRRKLELAGFKTQRIKGYAHKRHMTIAYKP